VDGAVGKEAICGLRRIAVGNPSSFWTRDETVSTLGAEKFSYTSAPASRSPSVPKQFTTAPTWAKRFAGVDAADASCVGMRAAAATMPTAHAFTFHAFLGEYLIMEPLCCSPADQATHRTRTVHRLYRHGTESTGGNTKIRSQQEKAEAARRRSGGIGPA
jgi:hypothetical protein